MNGTLRTGRPAAAWLGTSDCLAVALLAACGAAPAAGLAPGGCLAAGTAGCRPG